MRLLFTFIYLGEKYQKEPSRTKYIIDCSSAGNNILQYLIKYSDQFNLPFYYRNLTCIINDSDYRFQYNGKGDFSSREVSGEYYADVFKQKHDWEEE
jgi:hypothetical protein